MGKKSNKKSEAGPVQVFELTMDNPENQEELNRRLRKPGEPALCPPVDHGGPGHLPRTGAPGDSESESPNSGK